MLTVESDEVETPGQRSAFASGGNNLLAQRSGAQPRQGTIERIPEANSGAISLMMRSVGPPRPLWNQFRRQSKGDPAGKQFRGIASAQPGIFPAQVIGHRFEPRLTRGAAPNKLRTSAARNTGSPPAKPLS